MRSTSRSRCLRFASFMLFAFCFVGTMSCKKRSEVSDNKSLLLKDRPSVTFWQYLLAGRLGVCYDESNLSQAAADETFEIIKAQWAKWQFAVNRHRKVPLDVTPTRERCGTGIIKMIYASKFRGKNYTGHVAFPSELIWVVNPTTGYQLWAPAYLHELGHFLGLDHTKGLIPEFASLMNYDTIKKTLYANSVQDTHLYPDDLNGAIQAMRLYDPQSFDDRAKYKITQKNSAKLGISFSVEYFGSGLLVNDVISGGPADGKVRVGGIVLEANGEPVYSFDDIRRIKNASNGTILLKGMSAVYTGAWGEATIELGSQSLSLDGTSEGSTGKIEDRLEENSMSTFRNSALIAKSSTPCDQSIWGVDEKSVP